MKNNIFKTISIILVVALLIIGFDTSAKSNGSINEKNMLFSFSGININEDNDYAKVELKGTNSMHLKKDNYIVPLLLETFTFPMGSEIISIQCTPINIHREIMTKELMIAPEPLILGQQDNSKEIEIEREPISVDKWCIYDVGCGLIKNERSIIVKVQIFPVQYKPSGSSIEWAENIELKITYKQQEKSISYNDEFAFIILTPDEYFEELEELEIHKNSRGVSTKLVTLTEIYNSDFFPVQGRDDQEKIKYFIKNAIENWGTSNVLLVGGSLIFPTRSVHFRTSFNSFQVFVSDLYFADVYNETGFSSWDTNNNNIFGEYLWGDYLVTDEIDLYPDVHLGRIACINEEEVVTCVNKIITYENNEAWAQDWFTNIISAGGDTFPISREGIIEGEYCNQIIIEIMEGFIPDKLWASNKRLMGENGVGNINEAINKGAGFIDFEGHGNTDGWLTHPVDIDGIWIPTPTGKYRNIDVANLSNGDKLPIVIICACSTSKFDEDNDCFGWSFLSNPNGGGIASLSATDLSYGANDGQVNEVYFGKIVKNAFIAYEEGTHTFGEIWSNSINDYITPDINYIDLITVEQWIAFGDPSLQIAGESTPPNKPDAPYGPTSGGINKEHTYTASTTDSDGDQLYYLFEWGDGEVSGWIGPYDSGVVAEASHEWEKKGNYQIRVKAKDEHGVMGEWSDPLPVSMPRGKYPFNPMFIRFIEQHPHMFPILRYVVWEDIFV